MPTTEELLQAQRALEQKRAADKSLLEAGTRPKLRIVKRTDGDFPAVFAKALEEHKTAPRCPKCDNEIPSWGGPYCDCPVGQSTLASHRRTAEAEKSRQQAREAERRQELCKKLQKAGGFVVPEKYKGFTPKTLHDTYGVAVYRQKEEVVKLAQGWADGTLERSSLLVTGDFGTGKSALCFWAVRRRVARTNEVPLLIRYRQFIDVIQDCYRRGSENRKLDFVMGAQQAEILMLDDFGHVNLPLGTEAHPDKQEIMLEVLDWRTQNDMPTLIVTNLTQARLLAQFNGAITGRLMELCMFVEMGGRNLREKDGMGW